jgi:hypothetical protein
MSSEQVSSGELDGTPRSPLAAAARHVGNAEVLALTGEIDAASSPQMRAEVQRCLDGRLRCWWSI